MKTLTFSLIYHTNYAEHPELVYSLDNEKPLYYTLQSKDQNNWQAVISVPDECEHIRYAYQITNSEGRPTRIEQNSWRYYALEANSSYHFVDAWAENSLPTYLHRAAFEQCVFLPGEKLKTTEQLAHSPYVLLLHALPPAEGWEWAVVGSSHHLGQWDVSRALKLNRSGSFDWAVPLTAEEFQNGVEYKYLLINSNNPADVIWEMGSNRFISPTPFNKETAYVRQDERPAIDFKPWHGVGCVIPVFSLRSEGSQGVGDFGDLLSMVRWSAKVGMNALQLLPINDTTRTGNWTDSYPYNGISVFALHPIYLDLREWQDLPLCTEFLVKGKTLNALSQLDYEQVFKLKMEFLHLLYKEKAKQTRDSVRYRTFVNSNKHWLPKYAAFCALRDLNGTANFRDWKNAPHPDEVEQYAAKHSAVKSGMLFYTYVQYLLHEQMTRVHAEARKVGVVLKGDIPIGISRDSVPAWVDGRLFHFDGQAGAPPDDFAVHGQNWGFPTYNWDEMAKDHYQWWRNRLQHMQHYFDAYRIDHVLGFFRIWEVPSHQVYGLLGHFRPALPFSESEIRAWGFTADVKRYCVPRVSKERMAELVKQSGDADFQTKHFTLSAHGDYELNPEYRAQVKAWLMPESPARSLLLDAACEVLFVPDPDRKGYYHPRVGAQQTDAFAHLSAQDQAVFAHLHEDFFYHRNNQYWADEAMKKIPVVTQSHDAENLSVMLRPVPSQGMLPCAEDLGMVPASVKGVLNRLNILSLEIQRMPKEMGVRFGNVANNPYLSVATIATHDMAPLRLWWTENREQTQTFWRDALHHPGEAPQEATPAVCREIVESHLQSPSMFCLLALQDWLAISPELRSTHPEQEQINVPANPNQYWQYRMHLTLEALSKHEAFNHLLKELIRKSR